MHSISISFDKKDHLGAYSDWLCIYQNFRASFLSLHGFVSFTRMFRFVREQILNLADFVG